MNKFFGLVIMPDLTLKRMWMDNDTVLFILKENKAAKVYRPSSDQEALWYEIAGQDVVTWRDVPTVEQV